MLISSFDAGIGFFSASSNTCVAVIFRVIAIELVLGPSVTAGTVGRCMNHKETLGRQTHTRRDNPQEFLWTRIAWKVSKTDPSSQ